MFLRLFTFFLLLASPITQAKSVSILASPYVEDATHHYFVELLRFVIEKSQPEYSPLGINIIKENNVTHEITLHFIRDNLIDLSWAGTSNKLEEELLPIKIPLLKGLLGNRLSIIHKKNLTKFQNITKEQLQNLVACQGNDWGDTDILEANKFSVIRVERFDLMFKMLNRDRCDYFPRAIFEGYNELKVAQKLYPDLMIFDDLILHYKFPLYFFVNKENTQLAEQLTFGLEKAIEDGSFLEFMKNNELTSSLFPLSKWKDKKVFNLPNPFLPKSTPFDNKSLWIEL